MLKRLLWEAEMTPVLTQSAMYVPGVFSPDQAEQMFATLRAELNWVRVDSTPRSEYYCNEINVPYTYGRGAGIRTYAPQPWHPTLLRIKQEVERILLLRFEVCFLNMYDDSRDHLGWHADDSPEMDDARPIVIVTLGAARPIQFRSNADPSAIDQVVLESGSMCVMPAGMQDTHQHRIPKVGHDVGGRISLTFRGYVFGGSQ